jgi:hypothetical protein
VTRASVAGLVRIPFRTRDADATETFASLATVVIVGAPSVRSSFGYVSWGSIGRLIRSLRVELARKGSG